MTLKDFKKNAKKLPDTPGVYLFKKGRKILYIGKAGSLRDRVRSYFSRDVAEERSLAISGMIEKSTLLTWQKTDSVLEALILEANLIKKYQPPFNIRAKDNKSWNYVVITKETFPRVLLIRGRELSLNSLEARSCKLKAIFGPYPYGGQLQEALRIVRKIFPFRDTCTPRSDSGAFIFANSNELANNGVAKKTCTPCFNRQIGLCPGVCSGEVNEKEYAKTIRNVCDIFSGNFKGLKQRIAKEMKTAAKAEDFEHAKILRRQVSALEHIRDVSLIKHERRVVSGGSIGSSIFRIEAYDVAHTAGAETVGVMTVVEDDELAKAEYRTFKIHSVSNDDTKALAEMLARRLAHPEWLLPRLMVVDGGRAQVNAACRVLTHAGVVIPVSGVVKDEFHRPRDIIGDEEGKKHERAVLLANDEAHRFALRFHRRRRGQLK